MTKDDSLLVQSVVLCACGTFALCVIWLFLLQILLVDPSVFLYAFVLSVPASDEAPATAA